MKKPKDWYGFTAFCDLHNIGLSNMSPPSKQLYCKRKGRDGKFREPYDNPLKCNWNVCPRIKGKSLEAIALQIKEESNFESLYARRKAESEVKNAKD